MKLFQVVDETQTTEFICAETGEVLFPKETIYECRMIDTTVDYLLYAEGGRTLERIRYLIANMYNCNRFPHVELFSLLRNADQDHQELVMDIIGITQAKFGESCFMMIRDLAPRIIERHDLNV